MLTNKVIGTSLCVAALGWGAVRLDAETVVAPQAYTHCVDGSCIPRRATNGYYPTKWRRWPVEPPAPAERGVRPGIPAPPVELPDPPRELALPEPTLMAPPEDQGMLPDGDSPDRRRTAPPTDSGEPRVAPPPGLPPELRNETPRPTLDEQGSRLPGDDEANVETLRKAPLEPAPLRPSPDAFEPTATRAAFQAPAQAASVSTQLGARLVELRGTEGLPDAQNPLPFDSEQPSARSVVSIRPSSGSLNTPAAVPSPRLNRVSRAAAVADFTIRAQDSSPVLAVRTLGDADWPQGDSVGNPLRHGSTITQVAYESRDTLRGNAGYAPVRLQAVSESSNEEIEIPANPLR